MLETHHCDGIISIPGSRRVRALLISPGFVLLKNAMERKTEARLATGRYPVDGSEFSSEFASCHQRITKNGQMTFFAHCQAHGGQNKGYSNDFTRDVKWTLNVSLSGDRLEGIRKDDDQIVSRTGSGHGILTEKLSGKLMYCEMEPWYDGLLPIRH
jgi:hypothetical protein